MAQSMILISFYFITKSIIAKHIPLKKLRKRAAKFRSKPWITHGIGKSIKTKNKLFKQYITKKSQSIHSQ